MVSVSLNRKIINSLLPKDSKIILDIVKHENSRKLLFLKKAFQSSEKHSLRDSLYGLEELGILLLVLPLPTDMALQNCRRVTLFTLGMIHSNEPRRGRRALAK